MVASGCWIVADDQHPVKIGKTMVILAWLCVLGVLTLMFNNWLERQQNPNQHINSQQLADNTRAVILERNRYGHYVATGHINGQEVELLLDTGATTVSIPQTLAHKLKLEKGPAIETSTANGNITTYITTLDKVQLGDIILYNVAAGINPYSEHILLGMSFLKQLEFTQRGNQLILKQYPTH